LITGETGTGKELVARMIHTLSARKSKLLVYVNCGAISENLVEGELFGFVKGAFTGAINDHKGKFEEAHEGSIFLDELGDMALLLQVKLHHVIEYQEVQPVGGEARHIKKINVRIIAATRVDLEAAMEAGKFRDDLFERLNGFQIRVPALREHPEDIPELVQHFIEQEGVSEGIVGITEEALAVLKSYHWPRNVRQLRNAVRQAIIKHGDAEVNGEWIQLEDVPEWVLDEPPVTQTHAGEKKQVNKPGLERFLRESGWNVRAAAEHFGRSEGHIYFLMRNYGLQRPGSAGA
jgi:two-component system nitrogen regulation response regulator NtrX